MKIQYSAINNELVLETIFRTERNGEDGRRRDNYIITIRAIEDVNRQRRQKASAGDHNHTEKIGKKTSWMNGR